MTYVNWRMERTPVLASSDWDDSASELLEGFYDVEMVLTLGEGRDSFKCKLQNLAGKYDDYFSTQDKVTISRVKNSSAFTSGDVLMVGAIKSLPTKTSGSEDLIRIEGYNFTESIMSGIVFFDPRGDTISEAIKKGLNAMDVYEDNFGVEWHPSNPDLNTSGEAFPTVDEKWFNKPILEFVEKYSTKAQTDDVRYYWYVDNQNRFVWRPMLDAASTSFDATTDTHYMLDIGRNTEDVINWVIVKGGRDPEGVTIQARAEDLASIAKHGRKPYIITDMANNAESLHTQDLRQYNKANSTDHKHMRDATFGSFLPDWADSVPGSYTEYVEDMNAYVKNEARKVGENYIEQRKYGKLTVDLEVPPGKGWALGEVISCNIPSLQSSAKKLRVQEVQYTTTVDTYTLVEDEGTI